MISSAQSSHEAPRPESGCLTAAVAAAHPELVERFGDCTCLKAGDCLVVPDEFSAQDVFIYSFDDQALLHSGDLVCVQYTGPLALDLISVVARVVAPVEPFGSKVGTGELAVQLDLDPRRCDLLASLGSREPVAFRRVVHILKRFA